MHTHSHFSTQTIGGKFEVYKLSINSTNFTNFKLVSAVLTRDVHSSHIDSSLTKIEQTITIME